MKLQLKRPIVFFDLETTGTDVAKDRIVEISILKLHPDGKKEVKTRRVNPEMPIPVGSSEIHGIYDEDVKDEPTFAALAKSLAQFIGNSDLAGYNSNKFDVPLLMEEFLRVDVDFDLESRKLVDVQNIFHKMEQRTLVAAYKFYCGKDLVDAHSAEADIKATYEVLESQIERYEELENDVDFLADFSKRNDTADLMGRIVFNEEGVEVFNFGKHKGKPVKEVLEKEPSYYDWMMKGDFPLYTKKILTGIKLRGAFNR
ncbi:MAG: DNA polymerase III subunit epsilon [Flavobacteriales bacterium]|nr:DNA polymerase III subunit epsilon [Flavobacteriales bacterium]|tara:strand:- start:21512 stop:22282 length:771 start_codon:yes stop_codon:yes gene_type:complete